MPKTMIGAGDDPMKILALVLGLIGVAAVVRKLARGEAVRPADGLGAIAFLWGLSRG